MKKRNCHSGRKILLCAIAAIMLSFTAYAVAGAEVKIIAQGVWGECPWIVQERDTYPYPYELVLGTEGQETLCGEMGKDSDGYNQPPWFFYHGTINIVTFKGKVKLPADCSRLFAGFGSIETIDFGNVDTSAVTNMSNMFYECHNLIGPLTITGWNTSNVTDMSEMFDGCERLTALTINGWNTSNVIDMEGMFWRCFSLVSLTGIKTWNTSNVTDMSHIFESCWRLKNLDGIEEWDTSSVTDMSCMFSECRTLVLPDIGDWSTGSVTNMRSMFHVDQSFQEEVDVSWMYEHGLAHQIAPKGPQFTNLDLNGWDTSNVTDFSLMFAGCNSLKTLNISDWDTSSAVNVSHLFRGCESLGNIDVSSWKLSNVLYFEKMFAGCVKLENLTFGKRTGSKSSEMVSLFEDCTALKTLNLPNLGTAGVTDMTAMFKGCSVLNTLDVSRFNTATVTKMPQMFEGCAKLASINVGGWNVSNVYDASKMFYGCSTLYSLDFSKWQTVCLETFGEMFTGCDGLSVVEIGQYFHFTQGSTGEVQTTLPGNSWWSETAETVFTSEEIASNRSWVDDTYTRIMDSSPTWADLHYSFENDYLDGNPKGFHYAGYEIPIDLYKVFNPYGVAYLWFGIEKDIGSWSGSCAGFAATSVLFNGFQSGLSLDAFNADQVSDLKRDAQSIEYMLNVPTGLLTTSSFPLNVTDLIDAFQAYSIGWQLGNLHENNIGKIISEVLKGKQTGQLPIIAFNGHAVVGYDVRTENGGTKICVYDPNESERPCYISVYKDESGNYSGWHYGNYKSISIIPYNSVRNMWANHQDTGIITDRGNNHVSELNESFIYMNTPEFTVKNTSGTTVAQKIGDGFIPSDSDEVFLCFPPDRIYNGTKHIIRLPKGDYSVITPGNNYKTVLGTADAEQYAFVETNASQITFHTDDNDKQNVVAISTNAGEDFIVTLGSDLAEATGKEEIVIKGKGEGTIAQIGLDGFDCVLNNCTDVSVTLNEEELDTLEKREALFGKNLNLYDAALVQTEYVYTGSVVEPEVSVTLPDRTTLVKDVDFTVTYENNVDVTYVGSMARVILQGIGDYCGEKTLTFQISYDGDVLSLPESLTRLGEAAFAGTAAKMVDVPLGLQPAENADEDEIAAFMGAFPTDAIFLFKSGSPFIDWAEEYNKNETNTVKIRYRVQ